MTPLVDAPVPELIGFLVFLIGWNGGELPVFLNGAKVPDTALKGDVEELARELARRSARWDMERSCQVEIGLPRTSSVAGMVGTTSVLWAAIESREAARRCSRFRPLPSMVLKVGRGSKRLAFWGLREPIVGMLAEDGNKRLAYKMGSPYAMVNPDDLRIPVPGTFLRVGRSRPAPVLVTRLDASASYARSQVVARLKDPPKPWVQRQRESGAWA